MPQQIYPQLYTFRRCPYAIRARMAIYRARLIVEIREVVLRNKPATLLQLSPKGTVPVLRLPDGRVIDQSLAIMRWAISQSSIANLPSNHAGNALIEWNDTTFKSALDHYKYADRYPQQTPEEYRRQVAQLLQQLEAQLANQRYLCGDTESLADIAIFPFVRQCAMVDLAWFESNRSAALVNWLNGYLQSAQFAAVMNKYPPWCSGAERVILDGRNAASITAH